MRNEEKAGVRGNDSGYRVSIVISVTRIRCSYAMTPHTLLEKSMKMLFEATGDVPGHLTKVRRVHFEMDERQPEEQVKVAFS